MNALRLAIASVVYGSYLFSASAERYDQEFYENRFAYYLSQALNGQQAMSGQAFWLTNVQQIVPMMQLQLLAEYEERFQNYGKQAGFTNSLLERYVLLPPGIKSPRSADERIILIAVQPLKKSSGKTERVFVSKYGDRFGGGWIDEVQLQQSLRNAGVELSQLPAPPPMPSMRSLYDPDGRIAARFRESHADSPVWARTQAQIADFCERFGLSPQWAVWIQLIVIASSAVFLWLCVMSLWRRFGRKRLSSDEP
jgi:hypothetical protein